MQSPEVVSVHQWSRGRGGEHTNMIDGPTRPLPLVDLRSYDDFDKRHLSHPSAVVAHVNAKSGAAENDGDDERWRVPIVNLPLSSLVNGERSCELPPRHLEFAVLVPRRFARSFLDAEDCAIRRLFFASRSASTMQSRKPWLVRQVLIDDDDLWNEASDMGWIRREDGIDGIPFRRLPRLWQPDPLISSDILPLLKTWITKENDHNSHERIEDEGLINKSATKADIQSDEISSKKSPGLVLDLGCGAGRDICYLAEELKEFQHSLLLRQQTQSTRSVHFVGIDNHKGSEKRCRPLWKNRGVDDMADSIALDLNKLHLVRDHMMDPTKLQMQPDFIPDILCIFAIRFLNRKLLSYIANSSVNYEPLATNAATTFTRISKNILHSLPPPLVLPCGAVVAISHFCKPEEGASWNFDHPKESAVLERFELKRLFEDDVRGNDTSCKKRRWHILKDDLIIDGDHGRTLIQFVARKVA
jgi:SAM-dependent methyltransferase